jgi:hypothetical protein
MTLTATQIATETTRRYIEDMFSAAVFHDHGINRIKAKILELGGASSEPLDTALNEWRIEIADLCAALAPIAVSRAATIVQATGARYVDGVISLDRNESREYARSLFDEAGIGDRFEQT